MKSTAIYPNRVRDKEDVERILGTPEFPEDDIYEFYTKSGTHIATGYTRIVYGDHGPYIEFEKSMIHSDNFTYRRKCEYAYYDEMYSKDSSRTMLYVQRRTVVNLPNPPSGPKSFRGNRLEGYADYKAGMVYVDPFKITVKVGEQLC